MSTARMEPGKLYEHGLSYADAPAALWPHIVLVVFLCRNSLSLASSNSTEAFQTSSTEIFSIVSLLIIFVFFPDGKYVGGALSSTIAMTGTPVAAARCVVPVSLPIKRLSVDEAAASSKRESPGAIDAVPSNLQRISSIHFSSSGPRNTMTSLSPFDSNKRARSTNFSSSHFLL